nr:histone deacetylase complex subunit sap18 [Hymenolepis microstoma]
MILPRYNSLFRLDATLHELSDLIKSVHVDAQKSGTVFEFAIVSPDPDKPFYRMRNIGSICSGSPADSDKIMLKDCTFRIGDMLDVAITPPPMNPPMPANATVNSANKSRIFRRNEDLSMAPLQQSSRRIGGGGGRDRFHPYGSNDSRQRRNFM